MCKNDKRIRCYVDIIYKFSFHQLNLMYRGNEGMHVLLI